MRHEQETGHYLNQCWPRHMASLSWRITLFMVQTVHIWDKFSDSPNYLYFSSIAIFLAVPSIKTSYFRNSFFMPMISLLTSEGDTFVMPISCLVMGSFYAPIRNTAKWDTRNDLYYLLQIITSSNSEANHIFFGPNIMYEAVKKFREILLWDITFTDHLQTYLWISLGQVW